MVTAMDVNEEEIFDLDPAGPIYDFHGLNHEYCTYD